MRLTVKTPTVGDLTNSVLCLDQSISIALTTTRVLYEGLTKKVLGLGFFLLCLIRENKILG